MAEASRLDAFVALSSQLTGFSAVELHATGVAARLLAAVDAELGAATVDDLLADPRGVAQLLADARFGPISRNLIIAWYCGTWAALPADWCAAYGGDPAAPTRVLFPEAYVAGLQWAAARAHPAGALQQGYGTWAVPPGEPGTDAALSAAVPR